jgi:hypothetical protein
VWFRDLVELKWVSEAVDASSFHRRIILAPTGDTPGSMGGKAPLT